MAEDRETGERLLHDPSASLSVARDASEVSRRLKRKDLKKKKRKQLRQQAAEKERLELELLLQDPVEQLKIRLQEQEEAEALAIERSEHEMQERMWLERERIAKEEAERRIREEIEQEKERQRLAELDGGDDDWEYVEDGPAEIIWEGNEIIVRKQKVKVPKTGRGTINSVEDNNGPVSNPLPPQSTAFSEHKRLADSDGNSALLDIVEHTPNFGTEQDKTHCPFHIKTGVCRFGVRCSRAHVYPDKSCTLLMKNMYNGPGLAWEHDEGLEYTDEEVAQLYEEFYEDVHAEFLKFGELVNFKVCRNGSFHLRGNVYVHYQTIDSAIDAYNATNGRFYAGKQITCEFVGVTRWRVALCGEYMKSHHRFCSHGTACNFLHCFRNPHGEYDWADWDNPPPRSWQMEQDQLFGRRKNDVRKDKVEDTEEYEYNRHNRSFKHNRDDNQISYSRRHHEFLMRHKGRDRHRKKTQECSDDDHSSEGRKYGSELNWHKKQLDSSNDAHLPRYNKKNHDHSDTNLCSDEEGPFEEGRKWGAKSKGDGRDMHWHIEMSLPRTRKKSDRGGSIDRSTDEDRPVERSEMGKSSKSKRSRRHRMRDRNSHGRSHTPTKRRTDEETSIEGYTEGNTQKADRTKRDRSIDRYISRNSHGRSHTPTKRRTDEETSIEGYTEGNTQKADRTKRDRSIDRYISRKRKRSDGGGGHYTDNSTDEASLFELSDIQKLSKGKRKRRHKHRDRHRSTNHREGDSEQSTEKQMTGKHFKSGEASLSNRRNKHRSCDRHMSRHKKERLGSSDTGYSTDGI